ncbi:DMT family transporter [Rudaea sp.]|uniref:DMT family transporter n=1 Tax=Rudaea sp. TaxID=2136325 RepID=UPI0032203A2B
MTMKLEVIALQAPLARRAALPAGVLGAAFVLLWCTGYPAAKFGLAHAAPLTLLVLRFGVAAALLAVLALGARVPWPRGRAAWHSMVTGALSLALQFGALYVAVALGVNVGLAALVIGMTPIATALIARMFGEPLSARQGLGFAFGIAGVALAIADRLGAGSAPWFAYALLLLGLAGIAAGTVYQKRFAVDVDPRAGLAIQQASATALLLPFALHEGFRFDATPAFAASLAWLVVVNSLAAFALMFVLLRHGAASRVAALFFLMPPVTAIMNFFVLGDPLTAAKMAGFALAASGVWLATREGVRTASS